MALPRPSAPLRVFVPGARPSDPLPPLDPAYRIDPRPHMKWARMLARVVRANSGFLAGSAEEQELEAAAYLALCRQALRFDPSRIRAGSTPGQLFQGWSKRTVLKDCERAAEKLKRGGVCQMPVEQRKPVTAAASPDGSAEQTHAPPRCRTCSEVFDVMAWGGDREEEEEQLDLLADLPAPRPVVVEQLEDGSRRYVVCG